MTTGSVDLVPRWTPIVEGRLARDCLETASRTAAAIASAPVDDDPSLAGGSAGKAVGLSYLTRALPEDDFSSSVETLIDSAVEEVARSNLKVGLMQGFTGVAWALAHLYPSEDATDEIENALIRSLAGPGWPGEYDLVSGLVGVGVFGLERFPRGRSEELLSLVVERLEEKAEPGRCGLRWFTPPAFILASRLGRAPNGFYNLGMAHGIPGIVALMSGLLETGIDSAAARRLLEGAVDHLLETRLPNDSGSNWPYFLGEGIEVMPTRLAWCYGDLGILCALVRANRVLLREDLRETVADVSTGMFERAPETEGVTGASLCHGTAGLALMSARLFNETGDARFAHWGRRWASETVELWDRQEALGYKVWHPEDAAEGDVQGGGFLAGTAGVAAALAAAATDLVPGWDRALLLSTGAGR